MYVCLHMHMFVSLGSGFLQRKRSCAMLELLLLHLENMGVSCRVDAMKSALYVGTVKLV